MKKTTKLLSVLLAVVMMLSCFTMASYAAIANTKTSSGLNGLAAYSADGAPTRFTTEERMSILFDWLDTVLAGVDFAGIHVSGSVPILGSYKLDVTINSVDEICASVDSLYDLLNSTVGGAATTLNLVGDLSDINVKNYWTKGSRRANKDQLNLVGQLLNILNGNVDLFENVLAKGSLDLGSIIGGQVDLSSINKILADLPGLILSKIYPLMARNDDTKTVADQYYNGQGTPSDVLNTFVNNLFKNPQSMTTYKENASGTCISGHTLPTAASSNKRYYYVKTAASGTTPAYFTVNYWDSENQKYVAEEEKYYRTEESEGVYTYKTNAGDGLKYYKNGTYWLPSLRADLVKTDPVKINVNTESAAALLYKFAPYVFKDLAPIALNGWAKHALATWMGATETKIYEGDGSDASSVLATLPSEAQALFTASVPYYQFSYSSYLAYSDDVNYYRWVDKDTNTEEWFELDMTTGNYYLGLFNFGYTVGGDFMNEFIPTAANSTKTLFQSLNDFLCKAARTILKTDAYNSLGLQTGDNAYLVSNLRKVIQVLLPEAPEAILGPDYLLHYDGYYQTLIDTSASNDEVVSALAAIIAKALMPQLILPSAANLAGQKVGAVLACVVRELVTQFVPTYNYDALIFTDYNTRTLVAGKDNSYWLDVILTMGVDVGMSYLSNLADVGRDKTGGLTIPASKTYTLSAFESNPQAWEASVDWIIDWALQAPSGSTGSPNYEWCWAFANLINTSSFTVALASAQDPWVKLDTILNDLLPLKQVINCTAASGKTWLETVLRDKLILGIADLKFEYIFGKGSDYTASGNAGLISIPSTSILRTTGAVPALWQVVRDLLNKVIYKVAGNANILDTSVFTGIDTLVGRSTFKPGSTSYSNCPNIVRPISFLLRKLPSAYTNVFMTVLPILEMFIGWKTTSQEYSDPEITWSADYLYKTSSANDGITMKVRNTSAGMPLKMFKADGTFVYEQAYDIIIDGISGTGITSDFTSGAANNTIAPWESKSYTIKASSVPTNDVAQNIIISYHVVGKSGAAIGGTRYLSTYIVVSKNISDISTPQNKQYDKQGKNGTKTVDAIDFDFDGVKNVLCLSRDDLEFTITKGIWYRLKNYTGDYTATFSGVTFTPGNTLWMAKSDTNLADGDVLDKSGELSFNPVKLGSKKVDDFVTGTAYPIGTLKFTAKADDDNQVSVTESGISLGSLYFADAGDLVAAYNAELAKNRVASQYSNATHFNAYVTAMKNAALLLTGPAMVSSFASNYSTANIKAKLDAIKDAVEVIDAEKVDNTDIVGILNNGLAATEIDGAIGADGQINFQDYKLYNYWLYEKNRTEARNIMAEYAGPSEPKAYIEGCWLPYDGSDKNEDLVSVLAAESNQTKADAITASMKAPTANDIAAYQIALSEWKAPTYSELYAADIAQKLSFYKQFLIDRDYSKVATGRAQLAQEIAYAQAQNYVEADYTAASWARYADALAAAQAANTNGTMQSFVFQAKYDLLVAQRQLRLAAHDYATQVGFEGLQALVDLAEGMFANATYFTAVDGTLDTEWTELIEALGYTANFGTGNDAWSMNLYADSATQLIGEELYYPSVRNDERVVDATEALQAAIDKLECTIKVVKKDTDTLVDQDIKYITNLVPGSLTSAADVLTHVMATSNAATLAVTAAANGFGTGTVVAATLSGIPLANYYVVIFGDINGDSAIDGFDAVKADRRLITGTAFVNAPQEKAADATKEGTFDIADVGAIINAASGLGVINQA